MEVARLDVRDYDQEALTLFVRGKAGHERVVPVPAVVADALDAYLADAGHTDGALLRSATGNRFGGGEAGGNQGHSVSMRCTKLMTDAGIKTSGDGVNAHALRHTCASNALDRCHDVRTVQGLLGHSSLATTQLYLRSANLDQMRAAMDSSAPTPKRRARVSKPVPAPTAPRTASMPSPPSTPAPPAAGVGPAAAPARSDPERLLFITPQHLGERYQEVAALAGLSPTETGWALIRCRRYGGQATAVADALRVVEHCARCGDLRSGMALDEDLVVEWRVGWAARLVAAVLEATPAVQP